MILQPVARLAVPPVVLRGLPRAKLAFFRQPWVADFRVKGTGINTAARFARKQVRGQPASAHLDAECLLTGSASFCCSRQATPDYCSKIVLSFVRFID
jgi:hypothetical protein